MSFVLFTWNVLIGIYTLSDNSYEKISDALKEVGYSEENIDNYMPNVNL